MKHLAFVAMLLTLCAAISSPAVAGPITLQQSDSANYWAGWANGTSDDGKDAIGTPDITGTGILSTDAIMVTLAFAADYSSAYLSQVMFNYNLSAGLFSLLQVGDLFIDDGQDGTWDWVIRASDLDRGTAMAVGGTAFDVYDFRANPIALGSRAGLGTINYNTGQDAGGTNWDYVLSGKDKMDLDKNAGANDNSTSGLTTSGNNTGVNWEGFPVRNDHPWAVSASTLTSGVGTGNALGFGWNDTVANNKTMTFDIATMTGFSLPGVQLGVTMLNGLATTAFAMGFAFNCANEVIFENFSASEFAFASVEVPEPSTLLLLATGLVGLVAYRRKRA